jgi:CheY-like chemotaxis protein
MTLFGRKVLMVGQNLRTASTLRERLDQWEFRCHFANTIRGASELLSSQPVDLVLSNTYLPDGTGLGLLRTLTRLPVTAFLCLPLENSCLWLPAIDGGEACLGLPALRPLEFGRTLEEMARCLPAAPRIYKTVSNTRVA